MCFLSLQGTNCIFFQKIEIDIVGLRRVFHVTAINAGFVLVYLGGPVVCGLGDVFFELTRHNLHFFFKKLNFHGLAEN